MTFIAFFIHLSWHHRHDTWSKLHTPIWAAICYFFSFASNSITRNCSCVSDLWLSSGCFSCCYLFQFESFVSVGNVSIVFKQSQLIIFRKVKALCTYMHTHTHSSTFVWLLTGDTDTTRTHTNPIVFNSFYWKMKWLESDWDLPYGSKSQSSRSMIKDKWDMSL